MHYQRYVTDVERRRAVLRDQLEKANTLRRESHLPTYDVDLVVTEREPLLTQQQFETRAKAKAGFARFRQQQLAKLDPAWPEPSADWQQSRALAFRRLFLEHQVKTAWQIRRLANPT